jgi:hypothetical protein
MGDSAAHTHTHSNTHTHTHTHTPPLVDAVIGGRVSTPPEYAGHFAEALLLLPLGYMPPCPSSKGRQFTCFTCAKVQMLTETEAFEQTSAGERGPGRGRGVLRAGAVCVCVCVCVCVYTYIHTYTHIFTYTYM